MNPMNQGKQVIERGTLNGTQDCEKGLEGNPNRAGGSQGNPHVGGLEEGCGSSRARRFHRKVEGREGLGLERNALDRWHSPKIRIPSRPSVFL